MTYKYDSDINCVIAVEGQGNITDANTMYLVTSALKKDWEVAGVRHGSEVESGKDFEVSRFNTRMVQHVGLNGS